MNSVASPRRLRQSGRGDTKRPGQRSQPGQSHTRRAPCGLARMGLLGNRKRYPSVKAVRHAPRLHITDGEQVTECELDEIPYRYLAEPVFLQTADGGTELFEADCGLASNALAPRQHSETESPARVRSQLWQSPKEHQQTSGSLRRLSPFSFCRSPCALSSVDTRLHVSAGCDASRRLFSFLDRLP